LRAVSRRKKRGVKDLKDSCTAAGRIRLFASEGWKGVKKNENEQGPGGVIG